MASNIFQTCEICDYEFDERLNIPLILECGHTYCKSCILKFNDKIRRCPKCRREITQNVSEMIINYSLMQVTNENSSEPKFKSAIDKVENLLLTQSTAILNRTSELHSRLQSVQNNLTELNEMRRPQLQLKEKEVKEKLKKMEIECKEMQVFLSGDGHPQEVKPSSDPLRNLKDRSEFFQEIYNDLNKEKIYTFYVSDKKLKFGEITLKKDLLFFHALDLHSTQVPKKSPVVCLDLVMSHLRRGQFYTFMKVTCQDDSTDIIIMEMLNRKKANMFINLCTGECGSSFRNTVFKNPKNSEHFEITFARSNLFNFNDESNNKDYASQNFLTPFFTFCTPSCVFVKYKSSLGRRSFSFCHPKNNEIPKNAIGRVIHPFNLPRILNREHSTFDIIYDCGVAVRV